MSGENDTRRPILAAGAAIGFGLGGFADVIVLHMLLQWHHLISGIYPTTTVPGLRINIFADGVLLAILWLFIVVGLWLLWRAGGRADVRWSGRRLAGAALVGGGSFNVVDEIVNHRLFEAHHIHPPNPIASDLAFSLVGLALVGLGVLVIQSAADEGN